MPTLRVKKKPEQSQVMCTGLCLDLFVTAHSLAHRKSSLAQPAPSGTRHLSLLGGSLAWVTWNAFLEDLSFILGKQLSATHLLVPLSEVGRRF